jgi:hypothetical protein
MDNVQKVNNCNNTEMYIIVKMYRPRDLTAYITNQVPTLLSSTLKMEAGRFSENFSATRCHKKTIILAFFKMLAMEWVGVATRRDDALGSSPGRNTINPN